MKLINGSQRRNPHKPRPPLLFKFEAVVLSSTAFFLAGFGFNIFIARTIEANEPDLSEYQELVRDYGYKIRYQADVRWRQGSCRTPVKCVDDATAFIDAEEAELLIESREQFQRDARSYALEGIK